LAKTFLMQQQFILIEEQGLRDGLQTVDQSFSIAQKLEWINYLVEAGVKRIQVTSFVNPKLVPSMADAAELCKHLPKNKEVQFNALVLNLEGVERAIEAGMHNLAISLSASNTHSLKNANKTIEQAKDDFKAMVTLAKQNNINIRGGIQCAFGCRYEGEIDRQQVYDLIQHHIDCGVDEIALADSTGMGNPKQVKIMMKVTMQMLGTIPLSLHLHNTENKGYANMLAAIDEGVTQFDTAFGGLGGCPFIKGATGNIATEDVVHMLTQMGYSTGIDSSIVAKVSKQIEAAGVPLLGYLYKMV
jgi:hydroxymethylglutaryl-CoA lyase